MVIGVITVVELIGFLAIGKEGNEQYVRKFLAKHSLKLVNAF
jgi:hypothetical protein